MTKQLEDSVAEMCKRLEGDDLGWAPLHEDCKKAAAMLRSLSVDAARPIDERAGFEAWVEDYALRHEPDYTKLLEIDCNFAFKAGIDYARAQRAQPQAEPVLAADQKQE